MIKSILNQAVLHTLASALALVGLVEHQADQLRVEGPSTALAGSLVRLRAVNANQKARFLWRVEPSDKVDRADTAPQLCQFTGPPGDYRVQLLALWLDGEQIQVMEANHKVTIGPGQAPPTPPDKSPADAIGRIRFGKSGCTATIINPRRQDGRYDVLTASHCIPELGSTGTLTLRDGRTVSVFSKVRDSKADICWLVTNEPHDDLPTAQIALTPPQVGTVVAHCGYGIDKPGNVERGKVVSGLTPDGQLGFDLSVSSGDSGGGIYRVDTGEIVACVCCTSGMSRYARMWGGSSVRAAEIRPKATDNDLLDWKPLPIPVRPLFDSFGPLP